MNAPACRYSDSIYISTCVRVRLSSSEAISIVSTREALSTFFYG